MSAGITNEKKPTQEREEKKQKPSYWERVIQGKGTVAEPWPTAEELWNDPEVQKSIQDHNQSVKKENGS